MGFVQEGQYFVAVLGKISLEASFPQIRQHHNMQAGDHYGWLTADRAEPASWSDKRACSQDRALHSTQHVGNPHDAGDSSHMSSGCENGPPRVVVIYVPSYVSRRDLTEQWARARGP